MPGFYHNKSFTSRIIFYHLISTVIVLLTTLLASFFLLQSNEFKLNQEHFQKLLWIKDADIRQAMLDDSATSVEMLNELIGTEAEFFQCL